MSDLASTNIFKEDLCNEHTHSKTDLTPYTIMGLIEIACSPIPPTESLWYEMPLGKGAIIEIVGPPGLGKSRIISALARSQCLGKDFAGLPTCKKPLKWLFLGTENSKARIKFETRKFFLRDNDNTLESTPDEFIKLAAANGFCEEQIKAVNKNFRSLVLDLMSDYDIRPDNPNTASRLTSVLKEEAPDILVIDPWGDVIAGSELDDRDVRSTIA